MLLAALSALLLVPGATPALAAPGDLTAAITGSRSYDRTYLWQIDKSVDANSKAADGDYVADFDYTVSAMPDGYLDSEWTYTGQVEIENTSTLPTVLTLEVSLDVGTGAA